MESKRKNILKRMISAVSGDILFKYMCLSSNNSCNVSVLKCWDQSECVFDLVYHMCLFVFVRHNYFLFDRDSINLHQC